MIANDHLLPAPSPGAAIVSTASLSVKEKRLLALHGVRVRMAVRIPLPPMSFAALRALVPGSVISAESSASEEVPLYAAGVALSWCEFEVVDQKIAVRLTRIG